MCQPPSISGNALVPPLAIQTEKQAVPQVGLNPPHLALTGHGRRPIERSCAQLTRHAMAGG